MYHDGVRSYVFLTDERTLLPIESGDQGLELVLFEYGLLPREDVTKNVIDALRLTALDTGRRTEVHMFSFYDERDAVAYVSDFGGGMYRLSSEGIEHVSNGTDGVLFLQDLRRTPLNLPLNGSDSVDWLLWLLDGIQFTEGALTNADQRTLVAIWILTLFFPQVFSTRIILALLGEKGSGKSSFLRRVGQLLFGPKFNVTALTSKPDDFDAAITSDPLVVADNADDAPGWLPDRLAILATGGSIKRRLYYTTNTLGEFPIVANLAVTSRTPNFHREDVAERLLLLRVERIQQFASESARLTDVRAQRNVVVGAILKDVGRAVRELAHDRSTHATSFRMADFADFAIKVAPIVGKTGEEIRQMLDRLTNQQMGFAGEDEPLFEFIDEWLADEAHVNIERQITVPRLGTELADIAGKRAVPWDRGNPRSFGQYFRQRKGTLGQLYGMTERQGHAGSTAVSFKHRGNGDLGDLGDKKFAVLTPSFTDKERTGGEK